MIHDASQQCEIKPTQSWLSHHFSALEEYEEIIWDLPWPRFLRVLFPQTDGNGRTYIGWKPIHWQRDWPWLTRNGVGPKWSSWSYCVHDVESVQDPHRSHTEWQLRWMEPASKFGTPPTSPTGNQTCWLKWTELLCFDLSLHVRFSHGTAGMLRSLRWLQRFNLFALRQPIMAMEHFTLIISHWNPM